MCTWTRNCGPAYINDILANSPDVSVVSGSLLGLAIKVSIPYALTFCGTISTSMPAKSDDVFQET
jgi:hypothetical protein